ncbi:MAG: imidazole glycerol phosphate synthase subunit HisH [Bacteroidaceae bacterium]|nr:imidazole glycerol phosphate synthase subunit HisH [Bacteroidaceae bacterium]MCI6742937.1 imidazole glycerol phosphate synthase subunit HisH [Paraprevotella sp.]MCI7082461.1 imidazole glycerol phosphate synthase subunit HisH [Paraprevotella sp.]MCI7748324.1 imidazole glycerol phosphate synthase subunit HisH [Paraprevotella sp.]MDD6607084.1 imidazole glycerol phosphate synthase subunit HisH [Paraprevotella sp.]
MKVAVVKYNAGNIQSVMNALRRVGVDPVLTDNPVELRKADRVIFPGQGEASHAMEYLQTHGLDQVIKSLTQPVLGICIGQQLMCEHSEEGNVDCLGIFPAQVLRFHPQKHEQKVPHMGWNQLENVQDPLLEGINEGAFVYFVHSFYVPTTDYTIATTNHILSFSSAMRKGNFMATQFHPEKSGSVGERILTNFLGEI